MLNVTTIAKIYKINQSTLFRCWNKVTHFKEKSYNLIQFLNTIQLKVLIKYINDLTKRGLSPTVTIVKNITAEIIGRQLGHN